MRTLTQVDPPFPNGRHLCADCGYVDVMQAVKGSVARREVIAMNRTQLENELFTEERQELAAAKRT